MKRGSYLKATVFVLVGKQGSTFRPIFLVMQEHSWSTSHCHCSTFMLLNRKGRGDFSSGVENTKINSCHYWTFVLHPGTHARCTMYIISNPPSHYTGTFVPLYRWGAWASDFIACAVHTASSRTPICWLSKPVIAFL